MTVLSDLGPRRRHGKPYRSTCPTKRGLRNTALWLGLLAIVASACGGGDGGNEAEASRDSTSPGTVASVVTSTLVTTSSIVADIADIPTSTPPESLEPLPFHVEGHRGSRGLKPENTLQAFETALDIGVSTLELDLHLSSDGQVVVWHDPTLGPEKCRFADHVESSTEFPSAGVAIATLTSDQLGDFLCDQNPDPQRFTEQDDGPTALAGALYHPVLLTTLFDFVAQYGEFADKTEEQRSRARAVQFNIETKRDVDDPTTIGDDFDGVEAGRFEIEILAVIETAGTRDRVTIQSFDHRSLWAIRAIVPDIRLAALTAFEPPDLAEYGSRGANVWSPNFNVVTEELVDEAHAQGLLVIPWTVNDSQDMSNLLDKGVDGLITDRPDIAASLR